VRGWSTINMLAYLGTQPTRTLRARHPVLSYMPRGLGFSSGRHITNPTNITHLVLRRVSTI
jgi:hypothetical protein